MVAHQRNRGLGGGDQAARYRARANTIHGFFAFLDALNFETLGYVIVAMFVVAWVASVAIWKVRRIEQRWGDKLVPRERVPERPREEQRAWDRQGTSSQSPASNQ